MIEAPVISDHTVEIIKRIDILASKLGVTAQFIFSIYVKQAFIQGIEDTVIAAAMLIITIYGVIETRKLFYYAIEENYNDWPFICGGITAIITIASCIAFLSFTYSSITELVNPNFWALLSIFQSLK